VDCTGTITSSNLRALLGDSCQGSDVEELIREADCDGDGRVSYADFLSYLQDGDEESAQAMTSQVCEEDESKVCGSLSERSRRLRATREFTEIIDETLPGKNSGDDSQGDMCAKRSVMLTPKNPRPPSPPKQRKYFSSYGAESAKPSSCSGTPKNKRSSSSVHTPPTASTDLDAAGVATQSPEILLRGDTARNQKPRSSGISLQPSGSLLGESDRSCEERTLFIPADSASCARESSPFVPPEQGADKRQPRWQQCFRLKWPIWRRQNRDEERSSG